MKSRIFFVFAVIAFLNPLSLIAGENTANLGPKVLCQQAQVKKIEDSNIRSNERVIKSVSGRQTRQAN